MYSASYIVNYYSIISNNLYALPVIGGGTSIDLSDNVDGRFFLPTVKFTILPAFLRISTHEPCVTALQSTPLIFNIASPCASFPSENYFDLKIHINHTDLYQLHHHR